MTDLATTIALFSEALAEERLPLLMELGESLPGLTEAEMALRDAGLHIVRECQAPVFLFANVQDGHIRIATDVPREAATARGFVGLLASSLDGCPVSLATELPDDLVEMLQLDEVLGLQRRRGLRAIYTQLRTQLAAHLSL